MPQAVSDPSAAPTKEVGSFVGRPERVAAGLERAYRRSGSRYLALWLSGTWLACQLVAAATTVALDRYLDLDSAELWRTAALLQLAVALGVGWAVLALLRATKPLWEWLRDGRPPNPAPELRAMAIAMPHRLVVMASWRVWLITGPFAVVYVSEIRDTSLTAASVLLPATMVCVLFGAVPNLLAGEIVMRPLASDLASRTSSEAPLESTGFGVTRKLFLAILAFSLFAAFFAGSYAAERGGGLDNVARVLAVTLLFSATVSLTVAGLCSEAIMGPVRSLLQATREVRNGNLDARVPVSTDDEFGRLAESFNEMVDGLRDREQLRQRNVEQAQELRASRARVVTASQLARRRVERDLHDGAQARLVLAHLKLKLLENSLEPDAPARALAEDARGDVHGAIGELRDLARGIYPSVLENDGLPGALEDLLARSPLATKLDCRTERRYPREIEVEVYLCCSEAVQNASKHAGEGATVTVELDECEHALSFTVGDDGRGYDADQIGEGSGVQNMADRIRAVGGELRIDARPGDGTRVVGRIPLATSAGA